ncbi:hypothetical protein C8N46_105256 [Kordia periserrulae]|uniref:Uncharacterized protein n=1 Tax=Kordia periserrulae TaxID=701523 RepID=A0A2T6BYE8_9FLAO|nr:hypothetical protein C8N46_105256 [Kordia periserrulae]
MIHKIPTTSLNKQNNIYRVSEQLKKESRIHQNIYLIKVRGICLSFSVLKKTIPLLYDFSKLQQCLKINNVHQLKKCTVLLVKYKSLKPISIQIHRKL